MEQCSDMFLISGIQPAMLKIIEPNTGSITYCDTQDDRTRKAIIMETYQKAVSEGDRNVYYIDGESFFKNDPDKELCFIDTVHPNDLGFYKMAKKIYAKMKEIDGIFR